MDLVPDTYTEDFPIISVLGRGKTSGGKNKEKKKMGFIHAHCTFLILFSAYLT